MTGNPLSRRALLAAGFAGGAGLTVTWAQGRAPLPRTDGAQVREFKRQFRAAMALMAKRDAVGATLAANALTSMAAYLDDAGVDVRLQAAAKNAGRFPATAADHARMAREAMELGADLLGLSVHVNADPQYAGLAYDALLRGEGVALWARQAAAAIQAAAARWPRNGFLVAQLQDNGDPNAYRSCPVCQAADSAWSSMEYICAIAQLLALIDPPAMAACYTAIALWMSLEAACQAARLFGC
jgi:hypothetical protein